MLRAHLMYKLPASQSDMFWTTANVPFSALKNTRTSKLGSSLRMNPDTVKSYVLHANAHANVRRALAWSRWPHRHYMTEKHAR